MRLPLRDLLAAAFADIVRAKLPAGYDAADLLAAGARPELLPPPLVVAIPDIDYDGKPDIAGPAPAPRAPATDGGEAAAAAAAAGGGPGRGIPSGDRHRRLVDHLLGELDRRGIAPGAADAWRDVKTGTLASVSVEELSREIWFGLLENQSIALGHIGDLLEAIAQRKRAERRAELLGRLVGKPATGEGLVALQAWVRAVTGRDDQTDVRVMAHWLWLVKRLAAGLGTEWDLMPIVFGKEHGSGKSTATERLVAPLEELATTINAATLTDERRFRPLHTLLVGRWEEMAGGPRAEIEALKHTVTAHEITYRTLSTHSMVVARRTMSFIGSSNNPVDQMIADTTGARRFYQLNALPKLDHEVINRLDASVIWNAVNERERAPIHDVIAVVREAQAELVHQDAVTLWLIAEHWNPITVKRVDSDTPFTVDAYDERGGCTFEDLAARFKRWCNEVGQAQLGVKMLAQRLKQEGWIRRRPAAEPGKPREWRYFRPPPKPAPTCPGTEIAPTAPAAPEEGKPTRGERIRADPKPAEDLFAGDAGGGVDDACPPF